MSAESACIGDGRRRQRRHEVSRWAACTWSKKRIGMPSVIPVGKRLAVFYDAPGGDSTSHMGRDIGLAWLELPLTPPRE